MSEPAWPPKSPAQALLSSPGGRRKYHEMLQRRDRQTSPSPTKPRARIAAEKDMRDGVNDGQSGEDEEDEETLQLQLQAIQAKLKLKKLQSKRAARTLGAGLDFENDATSTSSLTGSQPGSRAGSALEASDTGRAAGVFSRDPAARAILRSKSAVELQVPLSPVKRRPIPEHDQRSPGRVLLGIDKGRSGADVSLRRPPTEQKYGAVDTLRNATRTATTSAPAQGKSFNERMAERREKEKEKLHGKARSDALRQQRSAGFGIQKEELEAFKKQAEDTKLGTSRTGTVRQTNSFSREQIVNAARDPHKAAERYENKERAPPRAGGTIGRSNSTIRLANRDHEERPGSQGLERPKSSFLRSRNMDKTQDREVPDDAADDGQRVPSRTEDTSLFEPISSTPLARRILPHSFLERTLSGKTHVPLTSMLQHIKAPDWELPDEVAPPDQDLVVFGVIGSKSPPLDHRGGPQTHDDTTMQTSTAAAEAASLNDQKKYMIFTLVSPCLQWSIDMYLFGTGYTRWRMLTPGTVIAIMNPGIMPPPPGRLDTNRWSMKLGSSDDTILEIGVSSDIGWCKAVKKNGHQCGAWVDKSKHEVCEFHVEMNVERMRAVRMDAQGGGDFTKNGGTRGRGRGGWGKKREKEDPNQLKYDKNAQSSYYISAGLGPGGGGDGFGFGRSAASLLDFEASRGGSKEQTRKLLAAREKERELARELGRSGRGAGAEYMSKHGGGEETGRTGTSSARPRTEAEENKRPKDAKELGLHGGRAADVQLSPLKRKLSRLGDKGKDGTTRKKTRFVTSRGIKVAGRESLPGGGQATADSDDDLEIV